MATIFHPRPNYFPEEGSDKTRSLNFSIPIARILFSQIFIISGFTHFTSGSVSFAESMNIPMPDILVPISGLMAIIGGGSILMGIHTRFGAALILFFLIPVTVMMHPFWTYTNPAEAQIQVIQFLKNIALMGGAILLIFYGAGPMSIDQRKEVRTKR